MTPAELIEAALHEHMRLKITPTTIDHAQRGWLIPLSGREAEDAAIIALDALTGAGLVIVPAADLRTYAVETDPDFRDYARAQARLRAALPEETPNA